MKNVVITWPTVAFTAAALVAFVVLVVVGRVDLAAAAGAVGTVLGAAMRQAAYRKPRSEWETDPQIQYFPGGVQ